jgi:carboxymethylenebutenolidase
MCTHESCGPHLSRREFVGASATVLATSAWMPLAAQSTVGAQAPARAVDDVSVQHGPVELPSGDATIGGYLARPKREGTFPGIVVIPGSWILEPYIPEFAAQLAQAGFAALVVDVFHQFPEVEGWEEAQAVPWETTQAILREHWTDEGMLQDVRGGFDHLRAQAYVAPERLGITGFCGGGWNAILFAADNPELVGAVVPFYAPPDAAKLFGRPFSVLDVLGSVEAPLQAHYGTRDRNFPAEDVERFRTAAAELDPPGEVYLYDAEHGFMAYNRDPEYAPEAAKLAFERTVAFFHRHLDTPASTDPGK